VPEPADLEPKQEERVAIHGHPAGSISFHAR
jgi:hypothetical protein